MASLNSTVVDTKKIKLTLKMPRLFGFRMWLSVQIIKLAALVAPVTIELIHDHD